MFFSVIVPTFNRECLLKAAIESVLQQEFEDCELIVVDDGSTDGTSEMLKQYDGRITVVVARRIGPSAARNLGAKHACGRYLAFLDSDDLWLPWTLSIQAHVLRSCEFPKAMIGAHRPFKEASDIRQLVRANTSFKEYMDYLAGAAEGAILGTNLATVERQYFAAAGGLDESMGVFEDQDFGLRIGTVSPFVAIQSPITIGYRVHAGNFTLNAKSAAKGIRRIVEKEKAGTYPGGHKRARERREIITRSARSTCAQCIKEKLVKDAFGIYMATLTWHLRLRRIKFLFGVPLLVFVNALRRVLRGGIA